MALDRTVTSIEVDIASICDETLDCLISLELDSEYNGGRSCFEPGEECYFRVYSNTSYTMHATMGTPDVDSRGVTETIEDEYVEFTDFAGATLKPIRGIVSMQWVGTSLGSVKYAVNTNRLVASRSSGYGFGILKVSYNTRYDRYKHTLANEGKVIVFAVGSGKCGETSGSLTLEFSESCAEEDNEVTLIFKNFKTGEVIAGVQVTVDGTYRGATDADGELYIGLMASGEHTIVATHPDYSPTSGDLLDNDTFTVSGSGA